MTITSRIALAGSVAGVVLWAAKSVAMAVAGGLGKSPLEGPLFFLGFIAVLVASAAYGVGLTSRQPIGVRALAGVAGLVGNVVLILLLGAVVSVVQPDHPGWVWGETNLWAGALVVLGLVVRTGRAESRPPVPGQAAAQEG